MDFTPALHFDFGDGIFIGALIGFILALPTALFLSFWFSAVKNRGSVVAGAFLGGLIGFLIIYGTFGTLIFDTPMKNVDGAAVFFGSLFFCSVLALTGGILSDLFIARVNARDYRRVAQQH